MELKDKYILENLDAFTSDSSSPSVAEMLRTVSITVAGGRIAGIMPADIGAVKCRAGGEYSDFQRIDCTGLYAYPGLIDAHVHLPGAVGDEFDTFHINDKIRTIHSVAHSQQLLKYGFTSVRDISWNGLYLKRVFNRGILPGPRIVSCGPGLSRSGGHSDLPELPFDFVKDNHFWGVFADGREEIRKTVRLLIREGADQIKIWASGGGNNDVDKIAEQHYSFEEISMAVEEASFIRGTTVCAHAEENGSIRDCIKAGVRSIEHGEDLDEETADLMIEKGVILVPTINLIANWYRDFMNPDIITPPAVDYGPFFQRDIWDDSDPEKERERSLASYRLAVEKGVKIAMGSDSVDELVTPYGRYSSSEIISMAEFGMSPAEALLSATSTAAEVIGLGEHTGVLKEGFAADIVLFEKNPLEGLSVLEDSSNIKMVIKDGRLTVEDGRLAY